jgi:hypothetical protein
LDPSAGGEMWGMYFMSECWIVLIIFIFNIFFYVIMFIIIYAC